MKKLILIALLAFLPGFLFAETIMLYTRMQPVETEKGKNIDRFIAVEDGVEDQFYSSGHIIFDAGVPRQAEAAAGPVNKSDAWAQKVAISGGAGYLLLVNLTFPDGSTPAVVPDAVSYRFADLKTGKTLAEGTLQVTLTKEQMADKKPYDLCFALGQKIARDAMSNWRPNS